jgi:hypothetical protein
MSASKLKRVIAQKGLTEISVTAGDGFVESDVVFLHVEQKRDLI